MNVFGIGVDIVEVARIRALIERHGAHFLDRVFTEGERLYCSGMRDSAPYYAARFAAKEAVSKALGTGIGEHVSWLEIDVLRNGSGKPSIQLHGSGAEYVRSLGAKEVLISLSHSENYAIAQAMLVG